MAITIRDVARAAGVSTATVSRALRGLPNVDEQTRLKVCSVASELDYVVSPSASRLASGRTGSVAVITPYIARWFFSTVLSGIESVLQTAGIDLLLMSVSTPEGQRRLPPAPRLRRRVDGAIAIALPSDDPELHEVLDLGIPTSLVGLTRAGVPSVSIDDVQAARTATQHLVELGHQRIGIIRGTPRPLEHTAGHDRELGFRQVLEESGLVLDPRLQAYGHFTVSGGEQAMSARLQGGEPPSAVFAMSDEMAFGAMRALSSHGLRAGEDVAIIGIDDHDMSAYLELSTVAQPVFELGKFAAQALLSELQSGVAEPTAIRLPTQLVPRRTTLRSAP
jgi:DNA-binding LacI/PurR family transcriptional regulator